MILEKKKLTKIKGDASFREFYRKKLNSNSSIVVYANKEKVKNLLIYDAVNKLLIKNRILAILAAPAAIPPNPKIAATTARIIKITVQRNMFS